MTEEFSESADFEFKVLDKQSWRRKIAEAAAKGDRKSKELRDAGHKFKVEILAPNEMSDQESVQLAAVTLPLNWRLATRLEMVEDARNVITKALLLESLDPGLPLILSAIIGGRGLYEHGIGEFFLLYGRFEEKYGTTRARTRKKMEEMLNGDPEHMKVYKGKGGREEHHPLPYAVRNILAHGGTNPNRLDQEGNELRQAIGLLKEWTK